MLEPEKNLRFNRVTHRLHIEGDWPVDLQVGGTIIVECYATVDPETFTELYDNILLKKYVTALIKRQWGQNLLKFRGTKLPGGVELNGRELYEDAQRDLDDIKQRMIQEYELPPYDFIG